MILGWDVRFWHKADIPGRISRMSAFGGKADIQILQIQGRDVRF